MQKNEKQEIANERINRQRDALRAFWRLQGDRNKKTLDADAQAEKKSEENRSRLKSREQNITNISIKDNERLDIIKKRLDGIGKSEYLHSEDQKFEKSSNPEDQLERTSKLIESSSPKILHSIDELENWEKKRKQLAFISIITITIAVIVIGSRLLNETNNRKKESYYQAAILAYENSQWNEAIVQFNQVLKMDINYKNTYELLKETNYQIPLSAYQLEKWDEVLNTLPGFINKYGDIRESGKMLQEAYYQKAILAINDSQWDDAWGFLEKINKDISSFKNIGDLKKQALVQGSLMKNKSFSLSGNEMNVDGANTHIELSEVEFSGSGYIKLYITIVVDSGFSTTVYKPDKVYLAISNMQYKASEWGGIYGEGKSIEELYLGGQGDKKSGWISFDNVVSKLKSSGCFDFHYGVYYVIKDICIF